MKSELLLGDQREISARPQTPITNIFLTKSRTLKFAKKLPSRGIHYKALPDL